MQKEMMSKLAIVGVIGVFLMIPIGLIWDKIDERNNYRFEAKNAVAKSWTGTQNIVGPVIVVPYEVKKDVESWDQKTGTKSISNKVLSQRKILLPRSVSANIEVMDDVRQKGIHKIPVYSSVIHFSGEMDKQYIEQQLKEIALADNFSELGEPYLLVAVSDTRGINATPKLTWMSSSISFSPGRGLSKGYSGVHALLTDLISIDNSVVAFDFQLEIRGMEEITFVPTALDATVNIQSTWPHPQFIGSFLPIDRTIDSQGYQATWKITSFASNIIDNVSLCESGECDSLYSSMFGVRHIEAVDVYLQSERSLKYSVLFIGLSFVSFFLFEILKRLPIHPIQYTLIGFAIAIFYLLLFSLSEHLDFSLSYLIATMSCVSLMLFYLSHVLRGWLQASIFSGLLTLLYGMLYIIISAEDYALLMGAILTFAMLCSLMILTRKIDWYLAVDKSVQLTKNQNSHTNEYEQ
jgi:inner membrane protein